MRISINITDYSGRTPDGFGAELKAVAGDADDSGLDTVWVADHLLQANPYRTLEDPMLEAYTTLGFLAAHTRRVRLGTMVSAVTHRAPALLVKCATTLDVLSGGRSWFGMGAGYQQDEAAAMGLPLPPVAERFECLEETLQIAARMWSGDSSPFTGRRYRLDHPIGSPPPATRPHPPILIGGMGERRTLRLVARYADACNLFDVPDGGATVTRKLGVLRDHCEAYGRPYERIEKTISTRFDPGDTVDGFTAHCRHLAGLGIDHAVALTTGPWTPGGVAALATAAAAVENA